MKLNKYLAIACVVLALTNGLNLNAMENLNERLWQATYSNDQKEIKELLEAGANVNIPNKRDGTTILYRYLFQGMGDYKKNRADIIITLLAAGADISDALLKELKHIKATLDGQQPIYLDQKEHADTYTICQSICPNN